HLLLKELCPALRCRGAGGRVLIEWRVRGCRVAQVVDTFRKQRLLLYTFASSRRRRPVVDKLPAQYRKVVRSPYDIQRSLLCIAHSLQECARVQHELQVEILAPP